MANLWGSEVYLRVDERDVSRVQVWSLDDRFLTIAPCNERLPANASEQQLRPAIAEKKRVSKLDREYRPQRMKIGKGLGDLMTRAAAAEHARTLPPTPPDAPPDAPHGPSAIVPHRSAFEQDLAAIQRASEATSNVTRVAVGAEALTPGRFTYSPSASPASQLAADDEADAYRPFQYAPKGDANREDTL